MNTGGKLTLMRTKYFLSRLENLSDFWGFFPRTFLPQTNLNKDGGDSMKITLFFIDTRQEIKVGVGLNFPPAALKQNQI